jgi:LysM repeat protein
MPEPARGQTTQRIQPRTSRLRSFAVVAVGPLALLATQPGQLWQGDHGGTGGAGGAHSYLVEPGDTLSEIAQVFDTSVDRLVAANGLHHSGDLVYSGDRIQIPPAHHRSDGRPHSTRSKTSSATSRHRPGPGARRTVWYTVRPGDTVTALAVRYHAWTDEVLTVNHLGDSGRLVVGQRLRIPVVLAALPHTDHAGRRTPDDASRNATARSKDPSHARVKSVIVGAARRHGVSPDLALAISWQEAGWQQDQVSSAHAIGAMQVLPSTGRWIETIVGRRLHLHQLSDNVTAGVVLLRELREAAHVRHSVAGYYQGLQSVRDHGMYDDTLHYVRNVLALRDQFRRGDYPY